MLQTWGILIVIILILAYLWYKKNGDMLKLNMRINKLTKEYDRSTSELDKSTKGAELLENKLAKAELELKQTSKKVQDWSAKYDKNVEEYEKVSKAELTTRNELKRQKLAKELALDELAGLKLILASELKKNEVKILNGETLAAQLKAYVLASKERYNAKVGELKEAEGRLKAEQDRHLVTTGELGASMETIVKRDAKITELEEANKILEESERSLKQTVKALEKARDGFEDDAKSLQIQLNAANKRYDDESKQWKDEKKVMQGDYAVELERINNLLEQKSTEFDKEEQDLIDMTTDRDRIKDLLEKEEMNATTARKLFEAKEVQLSSQINALNAQLMLSTETVEYDRVKGLLKTKVSEYDTLKVNFQQLEDLLRTEREISNNRQDEINRLNGNIEEHISDLEVMKRQRDDAISDAGGKGGRITELNDKITELDEIILGMASEIDKLTTELSTTNTSFTEEKGKLKIAREENANLRREMEEGGKKAYAEILQLTQTLKTIGEAYEKLKGVFKKSEAESDRRYEEIGRLKAQIIYLDSQIRKLRSDIVAINESHSTEYGSAEERIKTLNTSLINMKNKRDVLTTQYTQATTSLRQAETRIVETINEQNRLSKEITDLKNELEVAHGKTQYYADESSDAKAQITKLSNDIRVLVNKKNSLEAKYNDALSKLGVNATVIDAMNKQVSALESSVKQLRENVNTKDAELKDIKQQLAIEKAAKTALQSDHNDLKTIKATMEDELSRLRSEVSTKPALETKIKELDVQITELGSKLANETRLLDSWKGRYYTANSAKNTLATEKKALETTITDLEHKNLRIPTLEKEIMTVESEITNLENALNGERTKSKNIQAELDTKKAELSSANVKISGADAAIQKEEAKYAALLKESDVNKDKVAKANDTPMPGLSGKDFWDKFKAAEQTMTSLTSTAPKREPSMTLYIPITPNPKYGTKPHNIRIAYKYYRIRNNYEKKCIGYDENNKLIFVDCKNKTAYWKYEHNYPYMFMPSYRGKYYNGKPRYGTAFVQKYYKSVDDPTKCIGTPIKYIWYEDPANAGKFMLYLDNNDKVSVDPAKGFVYNIKDGNVVIKQPDGTLTSAGKVTSYPEKVVFGKDADGYILDPNFGTIVVYNGNVMINTDTGLPYVERQFETETKHYLRSLKMVECSDITKSDTNNKSSYLPTSAYDFDIANGNTWYTNGHMYAHRMEHKKRNTRSRYLEPLLVRASRSCVHYDSDKNIYLGSTDKCNKNDPSTIWHFRTDMNYPDWM